MLGRELHHDPTTGGLSERGKFAHWYDRTLESYRRIFGPPPQDIWPGPAIGSAKTCTIRASIPGGTA